MKKHPKFKDRRGPPLKKMPGGVAHDTTRVPSMAYSYSLGR